MDDYIWIPNHGAIGPPEERSMWTKDGPTAEKWGGGNIANDNVPVAEEAKFKIGDRVRIINDMIFASELSVGSEGVIADTKNGIATIHFDELFSAGQEQICNVGYIHEYLEIVPRHRTPDEAHRIRAINALVSYYHGKSVGNGWWPASMRDNPLVVSNKLALIHSEISEAMEGDRKNLMDDKLPHRKMIEVELADALIRICDLAGFLGIDLGGAAVEKDGYNDNRADHKPEARKAAGGKAY